MKQPHGIDRPQALKTLNQMLFDLGQNQAEVKALDDAMTARIEAIKTELAPRIDAAKKQLEESETALRDYAAKYRAAIADGTDVRVNLQAGAVIFAMQQRVKRIRKMMANLETAGRVDLIKIAKSVDWDSVDKLTDDELKALGTKREKKEIMSYEII